MNNLQKKNIALVCGGYSGEYEVSLRSAEQVEENLKEDFNIYKIVIDKEDWYYEQEGKKISVDKSDFSLTKDGKKLRFDAAFIIVHGTPGENGLLQGYFEMLGIRYNTCDALCSAVTFDKSTCNSVVRETGVVRVAKNLTIYKGDRVDEEEIVSKVGLPLFVKPSQGGSSIGMSKVSEKSGLKEALERAFEVHLKVLLEQFIKGTELSCGVMRVKNEVIAFPVTEIVPKEEFFTFKAKYDGSTDEIVPARISEQLREKIQQTTKEIYCKLDCRGVCRMDFIYEKQKDELYFLEVNTTPGQSLNSIVPNQVRAMGKDVHWLYYTQVEQIL